MLCVNCRKCLYKVTVTRDIEGLVVEENLCLKPFFLRCPFYVGDYRFAVCRDGIADIVGKRAVFVVCNKYRGVDACFCIGIGNINIESLCGDGFTIKQILRILFKLDALHCIEMLPQERVRRRIKF